MVDSPFSFGLPISRVHSDFSAQRSNIKVGIIRLKKKAQAYLIMTTYSKSPNNLQQLLSFFSYIEKVIKCM